ncbi:voltage-dependent calcium channel subunit alpha-2/delta-3-like [Babylonia areolata]|uniref:voltage-dependent calcium channel subunit alpha-2/delta-3-like n=1 Tax=Babylonia areolata TaxID=304850 RepID=UPI003FCF9B95
MWPGRSWRRLGMRTVRPATPNPRPLTTTPTPLSSMSSPAGAYQAIVFVVFIVVVVIVASGGDGFMVAAAAAAPEDVSGSVGVSGGGGGGGVRGGGGGGGGGGGDGGGSSGGVGGEGVDGGRGGGAGGGGGGEGFVDLDMSQDEPERMMYINPDAANETAHRLQSMLVGLSASLTGAGILEQEYSRPDSPVRVKTRTSADVFNLIAGVRIKMKAMLDEKTKAVQDLKRAAEEAMKQYGAYKDQIEYEEVQYYNAKKVVIRNHPSHTGRDARSKIEDTIVYLPKDKTWDFGQDNLNLSTSTSTVHVPTNIYDKSMKILNGVQWTQNLTEQFENNSLRYPTLRWQYFCSSDGFFRIFPGMQWPRDPEKVDVFDCRMQKWYIQAASTPKNIIILLDTSGSMTGKRFTIAQSTVSTILDTLSDEDYFNIIKFSKDPEYVDPCFNGTMMPANVDNIRRMQGKIMDISTKGTADLRKALTLAFRLFKEEERTGGNGSICNKAIMIITDGAPENYVDVYKKSNWPEKATRIFTYLIGKEVAEDRKVQWMACVNKGEFTHISTKADVQENVQQYIKVLSRPLAQNKSDHSVWSAVYLDYPTMQSDITTTPMSINIDPAYEHMASFKGMGLVISFAMPVFDPRSSSKVGKEEENPEKNLLGVVGTDVRINEIIKLIPNYRLGVNGYAFAVTNHGYVLFHPDFRPFFKSGNSKNLELRPKYNSVDLSEVELPHNHGANREHPLRKYLLTSIEGGLDTTQTVLTHFDGMKRVRLQKNSYQFIAVANTFRLVFVLPDNYGNKVLEIKDGYMSDLSTELGTIMKLPSESQFIFAPWIFCQKKDGDLVQMTTDVMVMFIQQGRHSPYDCDRELLRHMLQDYKSTMGYDSLWNGSRHEGPARNVTYDPVRSMCFSGGGWDYPPHVCMQRLFFEYGIDMVWTGTASGFTRYKSLPMVSFDDRYTATIHSLYYRQAVFGWDEGLQYVFYMDGQRNNLQVVMTTAEVIEDKKVKAPAGATAFRMQHSHFVKLFMRAVSDCPGKHRCPFTCKDRDNLNCYLIDSNGYILASNNNESMRGIFLGKKDATLMKELIRLEYFFELNVTDYQAMCTSQITNQESSSSFIMTPFRLLFQLFFWLLAEVGLFLAEWTMHGFLYLQSVASKPTDGGKGECGKNYPSTVRYFLCNVVVNKSSHQPYNLPFTLDNHACVKTRSRFALNTTTIRARRSFQGALSDCGDCSQPQTVSFTVHWLEKTNLLFLMAAADCKCDTANDTFVTNPQEVSYTEEQQCERLFSFSTELKRVDNTRTTNALCLDSRNEKDYTCGQPGLPPLTLPRCFLLLLVAFFLSSRLSAC